MEPRIPRLSWQDPRAAVGGQAFPHSTNSRAFGFLVPLRELPPKSARPRFVSHTATPRSRNDSLLQPRRKRAITLSPDGSTPRGLGPDSSNPVIVEMRKRGLTDFTHLLNQLLELNSAIQDVCNQCADHVAKSKQLPRRPSPLSQPSPLGKPAHEFSSTEDYVFFASLSIVNTVTCDFVLGPFHPAVSEKENARWMEEYIEVIDTCAFLTYFDAFFG